MNAGKLSDEDKAAPGAMIKSELVQRIASQNPHLYQRDIENIVNAVLGEITAALDAAVAFAEASPFPLPEQATDDVFAA